MRYLNIFVGGSIEGLENERQEINELVHIVNVANRAQTLLSPTIERTFITVCSFGNFLGQMYQGKINNSIQKDVDCAIFLINAKDASQKESCIGDFTKLEIKTVLENDIPYEIFIKPSDLNEDNEKAESEILGIIQPQPCEEGCAEDNNADSQFFYYTPRINVVIPETLRRLTVKRLEEASWANDNFAYYTIEARMKEIYTDLIYIIEKDKEQKTEEEKERKNKDTQKKAERTFEEFLNRNVYGLCEMSELLKRANECQCEDNRKLLFNIGRELSDITGTYKPSCYGEHHYEYIRRVPFLIAEFYFYYFILYQYLVESDKCDEFIKAETCNANTYDPYNRKKREKFQTSLDTSRDSFKAFKTLMSKEELFYDEGRFKSALFHCVSTNSTDLSQLSGDQSDNKVSNRLIIDHTKDLHRFLMTEHTEKTKAAYILDNFGPEFISDILFGVYLIKCCGYTEIEYCVKQLPIFVSDTTLDDYIYAISDDGKLLETLNKLNIGHIKPDTEKHELIYADSEDGREIGRMIFRADPAWHRPQLFSSITEGPDESNPFQRWYDADDVNLIIVKGDMNYRRLVGDCNYDYFDTIEEKIDYINKPLLILRSLKSNVILGVESICPTSVKPNWKTSGEYGIIHFIEKIQDTITERRRRCPKKSS